MKTHLITLTIAICLAATSTTAGVDPQPDSFGVYFDPAGNMRELTMQPVFTPYYAYLIVSNPTAAIDGFECTVTRVGSPHFVLATDLGEGVVDADPSADGYQVTRATPYPVASGVAVLVRWQCMQLSQSGMWIFVGPGTTPTLPGGLPVLRNGSEFRLGNIASESESLPVACVNGWCVSADEAASFGAIKSLYR